MDVMLLVEIDVATGKTAMIGLPRNLINAPFPPGPARDASSCGCFRDLLNALYVEATFRNPERWPGTGTVSGIGAVRAVVSELTGRPVDAVLVADLWGVIKVVDADYRNNRTLLLQHDHDGRDLQLEYAEKTLQYVQQLWGHDVAMETVIDNQRTVLELSDRKLAIKRSA